LKGGLHRGEIHLHFDPGFVFGKNTTASTKSRGVSSRPTLPAGRTIGADEHRDQRPHSPEQVLGGRPVDHRADIYGTGGLTYWLLTGQLVFTGDTPMQFLTKHAQATPEPPSARTELPIPKELDAIVLACLAKDRSLRPQTARELARRLEALPVSGEWTPEFARAWWETHQPVTS
jgi:hypothetical protein